MKEKFPPTKRPECGEMKGWNAHQRANERQCMRCKLAKTKYNQEWRHRTGRSKGRYYTTEDIAAIRAQTLREASEAYPLETAYGGGEYAVLWLKERAEDLDGAA